MAFLSDLGLVPNRDSTPPLCCAKPMVVKANKRNKFGWVWRCSMSGNKLKGAGNCYKQISPSTGTFLDGTLCRISAKEVLMIAMNFVMKETVSKSITWSRDGRINRKVSFKSIDCNSHYIKLACFFSILATSFSIAWKEAIVLTVEFFENLNSLKNCIITILIHQPICAQFNRQSSALHYASRIHMVQSSTYETIQN